jgi:monofunctional biosynthetic peptidoglycan transglycosylase
MKIRSLVKFLLKYFFSVVFIFICLSALVVFIFRWIDPPTTAFIQIKSTSGIFASTGIYNFEWKSIDKVSPYFPLAVIAAEDQIFFDHSGFDFEQIQKALNEIERGERFRGASTISQQSAKNLFLWEDQSFLRKGFEAYFTVMIELLWSKKRILEVYINICELGKDIYGIEAAAQKYFNKSSERLTKGEAALIATVLPRPLVRNPAHPSQYMLNRVESILRHMNNLGGETFLEQKL